MQHGDANDGGDDFGYANDWVMTLVIWWCSDNFGHGSHGDDDHGDGNDGGDDHGDGDYYYDDGGDDFGDGDDYICDGGDNKCNYWAPLSSIHLCIYLKKLLLVWSRNVVSFLLKPKKKKKWNSNIWNILGKIFNFGQCFTENRLFWGLNMFMMSLWHHMLDVCTYFGTDGKRRPIAILWYQ